MKLFFSIDINHDYDKLIDESQGASNDLAIVPSSSNSTFVKNNRVWFRNQKGGINCYIEDDESIKNDTEVLFFWVVCVNEAFYAYTDYQQDINFSKPYYYWSNSNNNTTLERNNSCHLNPGIVPRNAIGCIGIEIETIDVAKVLKFTVNFKVKETFWVYHIIPKTAQKLWDYSIKDSIGDVDLLEERNKLGIEKKSNLKDNLVEEVEKWVFEKISNSEDEFISFRSITEIPYSKTASNRLKLIWKDKEGGKLQDPQDMILPFANYAYKMVDKDNKELTPIYIHI